MSRAKTAEEALVEFLDQIRVLADYWSNVEDHTVKERCHGVAFSILNIIDGSSCLPAFDLVLRPHPDDREYCIEQDENWYEYGMLVNHCTLHDQYYKKEEE